MNDVLDASVSNPREGGPSFSLRHRLLRLAWGIVWATLGSWTPAPAHGWRRFLVRAFGARLHPTARIYPRVRIWYPPNLVMDKFALMGPRVNCYCMDEIHIGAYAVVSQDAHLCGGTHDIDGPHFQIEVRPISIGANAWIAAEAFVGPGVSVGENAVLGARGVTVKDLAADTVYAGNPARALRKRGAARLSKHN